MRELLPIGLSLAILCASGGNAAELTRKRLQIFIAFAAI